MSEGEQVKPKAKMGRPSKKTPKTVEELLLRIAWAGRLPMFAVMRICLR